MAARAVARVPSILPDPSKVNQASIAQNQMIRFCNLQYRNRGTPAHAMPVLHSTVRGDIVHSTPTRSLGGYDLFIRGPLFSFFRADEADDGWPPPRDCRAQLWLIHANTTGRGDRLIRAGLERTKDSNRIAGLGVTVSYLLHTDA